MGQEWEDMDDRRYYALFITLLIFSKAFHWFCGEEASFFSASSRRLFFWWMEPLILLFCCYTNLRVDWVDWASDTARSWVHMIFFSKGVLRAWEPSAAGQQHGWDGMGWDGVRSLLFLSWEFLTGSPCFCDTYLAGKTKNGNRAHREIAVRCFCVTMSHEFINQ